MELHLYYSPYCPHCQGAEEIVEHALQTLGLAGAIHTRNVLEHIDAAVEAGIRMTPAVTIDGRLLASGPLNTATLVEALSEEISNGLEHR